MRGFDKNQLFGLLLIGAVMIGYAVWTRPSEGDLKKFKHQQDSTIQAQSKPAVKDTAVKQVPVAAKPAVLDTTQQITANAEKFGVFAPAASQELKTVRLENEVLSIDLSTKGGAPDRVVLKNYKRANGQELALIEKGSRNFNVSFFASNRAINTKDLTFVVIENSPTKAVLRLLTTDANAYLDYVYTLKPNKFDFDFQIKATGMQNIIAGNVNNLNLSWSGELLSQEKTVKAESPVSTVYYRFSDGEVDYLSETSDDKESIKTNVKWVSFKQQYFTTILTAKEFFDGGDVEVKAVPETDSNAIKIVSANLSLPYKHQANEVLDMNFYFGPNQYKVLVDYDLSYEKQIPLGWGIFGWINKGIIIQVFHFLGQTGLNYGIVILILTIIIKLVLSPLTYRSYLSQAKMKILKPELDEIEAKHGKDPLKSQQEKMVLFKKAGVSPLGGCVPLLLQLPILVATFRFFPASIELRQQPFLWATDLSTFDDLISFSSDLPLLGNHLSIFNILMFISTILYTKMNSSQFAASGPQAKQMMFMSYLMPVIFFFTLNNSPAALTLYYFLANIFTFLQQFLMRKFVDEGALHASIQASKNKKVSIKKSAFQKKLEDMAKQRGVKMPK